MTLAWLAVALAAFGIELATVSFIMLFVAIAALLAAALGQLGASIPVQIVVFGAASLLLPVLLRKGLLQRISGRGVLSRTDALVGADGLVTEALDPVVGTGRVLVSGQDWAARATVPVPRGATVKVVGADGITQLVTPFTLSPPDAGA